MRLLIAIFVPFLMFFYDWPANGRNHLPHSAADIDRLDSGGSLGCLYAQPV